MYKFDTTNTELSLKFNTVDPFNYNFERIFTKNREYLKSILDCSNLEENRKYILAFYYNHFNEEDNISNIFIFDLEIGFPNIEDIEISEYKIETYLKENFDIDVIINYIEIFTYKECNRI